jgi:nucleoside-triphosphatase THEP1
MSQKTGRMAAKHLLLTGPPGIGKTTVIMRLAEFLTEPSIGGFYTDEIREAKA